MKNRSKISLLAFVIVIVLFLSEKSVFCRRDIPDNHLAFPVLIELGNRDQASGFYIENGENYYFVTAKHVLFLAPKVVTRVKLPTISEDIEFPEEIREKIEFNSKDKILSFRGVMSKKELALILKLFSQESIRNSIGKLHDKTQYKLKSDIASLLSYRESAENRSPNKLGLNLSKLLEMGKIRYSLKYDAAVVQIGQVERYDDKMRISFLKEYVTKKVPKTDLLACSSANGRETIKLYKDVLVGNEAVIFGYPGSIGLKQLPQIDYLRPLLRKGVIAGKNDTQETIILDSPTYQGNSGGPVVEIEQLTVRKMQYRIVGLVSQFVPFVETWTNKPHGYQQIQLSNSGYSVVVPMDVVLELMDEIS